MTRVIDIPDADKETTVDGVRLRVACELVGLADLQAKDWPKLADQWRVKVYAADKPEPFETDYRTGHGHRKHPRNGRLYSPVSGWKPGAGRFQDEQDASRPVHPSAKSVLCSLASDCSSTIYMPRDDVAAMDYLQDEFGHEGKASELLEMVRALRREADGLEKLFRGTGLTLEKFAQAQEELDS